MRIRLLIVLLACCFISNTNASDEDANYTLYLVRHAEKQQDGGRDPELTKEGKARSKQLANWFQDKNIKDIWSSDYKRTRDTAQPLVSRLGLKLSVYDPRDLAGLAVKLRKNQRTALIAGHSNTTPELARMLCDCSIEDMDESEYDRLIVISVTSGKTEARTLEQDQSFQQ